MVSGNRKAENIQRSCKQRIEEILKEYNVSYIDYDAREDDYTIRLERKAREMCEVCGGEIAVVHVDQHPGIEKQCAKCMR